jgi:hypothetical protein
MFLASKIVWAGVAFTLITTGIVLRNLPRSATRTTGSDSNKEGVVAVDQTEIKAMQETLLKKGDYQGRSMASSVYRPEPVFGHIRGLRICQRQGSLIPRQPVNSGSDQRVRSRLATRLRRLNLRHT